MKFEIKGDCRNEKENFITYANEAKIKYLCVKEESLNNLNKNFANGDKNFAESEKNSEKVS